VKRSGEESALRRGRAQDEGPVVDRHVEPAGLAIVVVNALRALSWTWEV